MFWKQGTHCWTEEWECQIYKELCNSIFVKIYSMVGGMCYGATHSNNACYPGIFWSPAGHKANLQSLFQELYGFMIIES